MIQIHLKRNIVAGVLTIIPLAVTLLIFGFILKTLSEIGTPGAQKLVEQFVFASPTLSAIVTHPWFVSSFAVFLTLTALYILGGFASWIVGRRLLKIFEALLEKIPFVQSIYGASKKLVNSFRYDTDSAQRVVLIDFPSEHMKTVGLVTATFEDSITKEPLAAVYVPTTPNPTSGYLEIVPVSRLVTTDWSLEDAMTFIISGGAVAPRSLSISNSLTPLPDVSLSRPKTSVE